MHARVSHAVDPISASDSRYEVKAVGLLALGFGMVGLDRFIINPLFPAMQKELGLNYQELGLIEPPRLCRRPPSLALRRASGVHQIPIVGFLCFRRRYVPERSEQPMVVIPVNPFERGELDVLERTP